MPDFVELMEEADERLFRSTLYNPHHTLHVLLPPQSTTSQNYQLRQRVHDRQLPEHIGHLIDKPDCCIKTCTDYYYFVISSVWLTAFCQFSIKKMMMMMMMYRWSDPRQVLRMICSSKYPLPSSLATTLARILVCKPQSADCERLISAYNRRPIKSLQRNRDVVLEAYASARGSLEADFLLPRPCLGLDDSASTSARSRR